MGKKLEGELLTAVLTAKRPVNGDLKRVLQRIAENYTGTISLIAGEEDYDDYYCESDNICYAKFVTKLKATNPKTKKEQTINATIILNIDEDGYFYDEVKEEYEDNMCVMLEMRCPRAGFKGGEIYYDSTSPYYYSGNADVCEKVTEATVDRIDQLLQVLAQKTAAEIERTEKEEEKQRKANEKQKKRREEIYATVLYDHGFVANEATQKAFDLAWADCVADGYYDTDPTKSELKKAFKPYAEMLKADPYKKDK